MAADGEVNETQLPVVLVLGPTAGGKTRLAIDLAKALDGECICADSMQVYRGMDIGTAKPTAAEQAEVPHHLLDLVEPDDERFSVDVWLNLAETAIAEIRARARYPVVVGGTNLYIQALLAGLCDAPAADPVRRAALQALDDAALRARLETADPASAERIHPNDRRRTIRAIEVFEATGRPLSDLQREWIRGPGRSDVRIIGLTWPVEAINRRINARVRTMVAAGLVDEVRGLWAGGRLGRQAREALGYKQVIEHLEGRCDLDEAIEQIKIRTRRFAKQQRTWLRRFRAHPASTWIEVADSGTKDIADTVLTSLRSDPESPVEPGGPPH